MKIKRVMFYLSLKSGQLPVYSAVGTAGLGSDASSGVGTATSGIAFAGRVSQLITASTGFDDWEWGVTLWSRAPEHIKDIVYSMRFDRASAQYAEFGPFYVSYAMSAEDMLAHLRI